MTETAGTVKRGLPESGYPERRRLFDIPALLPHIHIARVSPEEDNPLQINISN